ncbi:hypothetical protein [Vibrio lentus]|uniref:hypothetical protein n=1 Tax=Vibrio lentus TaxID=136468 RepID=UPI00178CDE33|nr:hypothetical protein [Vibrio lentus]MDN3628106.1 hypothetical protein [Vibrio lentus]
MKRKTLLVSVTACLSSLTYANESNIITSNSPEGVYLKYQSTNQVTESMRQNGFTLHRCGIKTLVSDLQFNQGLNIPHSQVLCVYSKPGNSISDESELIYWHLNVLYSVENGNFIPGREFNESYTSEISTHTPEYLLDISPHYYRQRSQVEYLGMKVGECNLQKVYYFSTPMEESYLSDIASCPVYKADGELSGNITVELNHTPADLSYSERLVRFDSI